MRDEHNHAFVIKTNIYCHKYFKRSMFIDSAMYNLIIIIQLSKNK